jgi:hypothetical protein
MLAKPVDRLPVKVAGSGASLPWFVGDANLASQRFENRFPFQVANTWPKITARDVYGMVRNRKEEETPDFSLVAATFEKAIT